MRGEIEFDVNDFGRGGSDAGVYANFYTVPQPDKEASAAEGRPVFKDVVFVEIRSAGNSQSIVRRPLREKDKRRFAKAYQLFEAGQTDQLIGTPLVEVPWITKSQVEELRYKGIRTLEDLAALSDTACSQSAGLYSLKQKAAAWVVKSKEAAPFTAMQAEIEELKRQLSTLTSQDKKSGRKSEQVDS